jgi:Phosphotransferase enzyme family
MCSPELRRDSPDDELIAYCANPPVGRILGGAPYGNKVIRLSDDQVIKFGIGVTREEAENQKRAFDIVDHNIIRVPRVYRFFEDGSGLGYLIMEYMAGKVIDPLEDSSCIEKIARVLTHFASLHGDIPGTLSGGPSCGLIFPETEELTFASVKAMEAWFNSRLFAQDPKLSLQGCKLVLCHLDIAPRNILWLEDGSICFLDWASAGYYPRIFEFCAQWIIEHAGKEGKFNQLLLDSMENLSYQELAQKEPILRAWRNIQKYSL